MCTGLLLIFAVSMRRCRSASSWLLIISAAVPSRPTTAEEQEGKGEAKELKRCQF